jgi:hypothetical protein
VTGNFFLYAPPPQNNRQKHRAFFEILTTRFIAEIFFSNTTCG